MKLLGIVIAIVLIAGVGLFLQRQNAEDARNSRAIERITSGERARPTGAPRADAQHRERASQSPAGARHRSATQ